MTAIYIAPTFRSAPCSSTTLVIGSWQTWTIYPPRMNRSHTRFIIRIRTICPRKSAHLIEAWISNFTLFCNFCSFTNFYLLETLIVGISGVSFGRYIMATYRIQVTLRMLEKSPKRYPHIAHWLWTMLVQGVQSMISLKRIKPLMGSLRIRLSRQCCSFKRYRLVTIL